MAESFFKEIALDIVIRGSGKNGLSFNERLAEEMYRRFAEMYQKRIGLYQRFHHSNASEVAWHKFLPEGITYASVEHRRYIFGGNLLDMQTKAETAFKTASKLWVDCPELFGPNVLNFGFENNHHHDDLFPELLSGDRWSLEKVLADRLKKSGYTSPNQMASRWRDSFAMLWSDFGGDPLKIFDVYKTVPSYLAARDEFKKAGKMLFPGLGSKLFSLLAYHLEEFGLIEHVEGALPVDLHLQSQHLSTRAVTGFGIHLAKDMEEFIRPRAVEVCYKNNIPPFVIASAMWFNGSENCVRCSKGEDGGQQKVIAKHCPIYSVCGGRTRDLRLYRETASWNLGGQITVQPQLDGPCFFELISPKKEEFRTYRSRRSGKKIS
jgi:hypothetical protein